MKATVNPEAEHAITDIAQRHGLSREAVPSMLYALHVGGGTMAQFAIPELGGSGQWMRGGMTMVGDMFASGDPTAIVAAIESLAGLHERGIISDEEFAAKKAELLGRL